MVFSFLKRIFISVIYIYQYTFGFFLQSHCRFFPTCSQYGIEMIEIYGTIKGCILIFIRIFKCHSIKL